MKAPSGIAEVKFPGPYTLEPESSININAQQVRVTLATMKADRGVLLFTESQLQTEGLITHEIPATVMLAGGEEHLKKQFGITDEQIVRITMGRLEGREYRGPGANAECHIWLRLYASPETSSSITIACIGDESFLQSAAVRDFMESFHLLR